MQYLKPNQPNEGSEYLLEFYWQQRDKSDPSSHQESILSKMWDLNDIWCCCCIQNRRETWRAEEEKRAQCPCLVSSVKTRLTRRDATCLLLMSQRGTTGGIMGGQTGMHQARVVLARLLPVRFLNPTAALPHTLHWNGMRLVGNTGPFL